MSKHDLLTEHETATARSQGWLLCEVFDLGKSRWNRQVLPLTFGKHSPNASATTAWVVSQARAGNKVALRALQLITEGLRK